MAPTTKEAQRAELHKTIWRIANDLRGSVDGWDFKSYVLGMLFYRFISENLTAYINKGEHDAGDTAFDYAKLADSQAEYGREDTVDEKGFYIFPSELFCNVRARAPRDENLNETLARVFKNIEGSAVGTTGKQCLSRRRADGPGRAASSGRGGRVPGLTAQTGCADCADRLATRPRPDRGEQGR